MCLSCWQLLTKWATYIYLYEKRKKRRQSAVCDYVREAGQISGHVIPGACCIAVAVVALRDPQDVEVRTWTCVAANDGKAGQTLRRVATSCGLNMVSI